MRLIIAIPFELELDGLLESVLSLYEGKFRQIELETIHLDLNQYELFGANQLLTDDELESGMQKVLNHLGYSITGSRLIEQHVVVLTTLGNQRGIIAGPSEQIQGVSFIQVNHYITQILGSPQFPVAYEIAVSVLRSRVFWSHNIMDDFIHTTETRGCINDYCNIIKQMELKIKTGDICFECMSILIESQFPRILLDDILTALEEVRVKMSRMRQLVAWEDLPLVVLQDQKLKIPSEGIEIHLKPMQFALYVLYAKNPGGISEADVINHYEWFKEFYGEVSSSSDMYQISVRNLCAERSTSRTQTRSQIKNVLERRLPYHLAAKLGFSKKGNPAKHFILDASSIRVDC